MTDNCLCESSQLGKACLEETLARESRMRGVGGCQRRGLDEIGEQISDGLDSRSGEPGQCPGCLGQWGLGKL